MKLSIIIPVFNERNTVENVVATVLAVDIPLEKEIVIVDDFSTDGTREILPTLDSNRRSPSKRRARSAASMKYPSPITVAHTRKARRSPGKTGSPPYIFSLSMGFSASPRSSLGSPAWRNRLGSHPRQDDSWLV